MIVVGARCAGAATAMLLARAGMSVLLVDRGREGTDTLSTHALMRAAVIQLHHWGVLDAIVSRGTPVVRSTTFHYGDTVVPVAIKPRGGIEGLYAPRRFVIDTVLVEAARAAGAEVAFGLHVTELKRTEAGRVSGVVAKLTDSVETVEISADLVIGADGMRSTVAGLVAAQTYRAAKCTTAVIFNYFAGVGLDGYHWYYRPGVSAGVITTNDGTCVFAALPPARFEGTSHDIAAGHAAVLRDCDSELAAAVAGATPTERYRGFAGQLGYIRHSYGPGWALIGDAAYFKDPLTAHGMTDALVDAEHLARAVLAGSEQAMVDYQRERDDRTLTFFDITDEIASFTWDLTTLPPLHRSLSDEMKREATTVMALHERPLPSRPSEGNHA